MSPSTSSVNPATKSRRAGLKLFAIFLVSAAPIVAGYLLYYFWHPASGMNYGQLIEPRALPDAALVTADGKPFAWSTLRAKWILLHVDHGDCRAEPCVRKLYNMRQSRLAQGKNMERLERVWLLTDDATPVAPQPELFEGMYLLRGNVAAILKQLPAPVDVRDHIYLVDPAGNVMLRYPKDADPRRMIRDLERLLKYSSAG